MFKPLSLNVKSPLLALMVFTNKAGRAKLASSIAILREAIVAVTGSAFAIRSAVKGGLPGRRRSTFLLIALSLFDTSAFALDVISIADGDTLTVLQDGRPARIRLANIDAPEKRQGFGARAKQSLSEMCYRKDAVLTVVSTDRYGRTVALVSCAGVNVNRAQVERGLAWVYKQYNKDRSLPALQEAAAAKRRGLWAESNPIPPWDFRRAGR